MDRTLRGILLIVGIAATAISLGFIARLPLATALWPWPDSPLSYLFLASIGLAIAVPVLWIGLVGDLGAARGGAINVAVGSLGSALAMFAIAQTKGDPAVLRSALVLAIVGLLSIGLFFLTRTIPIQDKRPAPGLALASFAVFGVVLVLASAALLLKTPNIFPWPLLPESSVIFGWIFLGNACYFFYGVAFPSWHNACGQYIAFLAYDLVLIGPFLGRFTTGPAANRPSLIVYTAVLVVSGLLALYYLFVFPSTRRWGITASPAKASRTLRRGVRT